MNLAHNVFIIDQSLKVLASKWKNVNGIKYFPTQDNFSIYHYYNDCLMI